jgi:hypothetical protein
MVIFKKKVNLTRKSKKENPIRLFWVSEFTAFIHPAKNRDG